MNTVALTTADFVAASPPQPLAEREIHLWFFPQWEKAPRAEESASVCALLAGYLARPIESLRIERGAYGKPHVGGGGLEFNLTHAADALLVGISRAVVLGVDMEATQRRVRHAAELARRFFAPAEASALENLSEPARQAAFLRLWCAKEAVLKAHGRGIGLGLDRVEFVVAASGSVAPAAGNPWHVLALAPTAAHVGALAHRGPVSRVRAFVARN